VIKISEQNEEQGQEKIKVDRYKDEKELANMDKEKKKRGRPRKNKSAEPETIHVKAERIGKVKETIKEDSISVRNVAIAAIVIIVLAALLYYVSFHGNKEG